MRDIRSTLWNMDTAKVEEIKKIAEAVLFHRKLESTSDKVHFDGRGSRTACGVFNHDDILTVNNSSLITCKSCIRSIRGKRRKAVHYSLNASGIHNTYRASCDYGLVASMLDYNGFGPQLTRKKKNVTCKRCRKSTLFKAPRAQTE